MEATILKECFRDSWYANVSSGGIIIVFSEKRTSDLFTGLRVSRYLLNSVEVCKMKYCYFEIMS